MLDLWCLTTEKHGKLVGSGVKDVNSVFLNCTVLVAVARSNPVFKHGLN